MTTHILDLGITTGLELTAKAHPVTDNVVDYSTSVVASTVVEQIDDEDQLTGRYHITFEDVTGQYRVIYRLNDSPLGSAKCEFAGTDGEIVEAGITETTVQTKLEVS